MCLLAAVILFVGRADAQIVPRNATLDTLFTGGMTLTEGAAVAPDGRVYFSDLTFTFAAEPNAVQAGHIWRYDPSTGHTAIYRSPSGMSNGIKFDANGDMLVAQGADYGGRSVIRTDMKSGKSYIIAGLYESRPFNSPNDITIDERGRIYFSDPRYLGHEPVDQSVAGVYRIDIDGTIHRIITDAGKPNGVALSPDQKTLYVVSNDNGAVAFDRLPVGAPVHKGRMALLAYDLHHDGTATFRKVLVDYWPEDGPDGLVVDVNGNLYVAERSVKRPGIAVRDPDGKELGFIPTDDPVYDLALAPPPNVPTNVAFGRGKDANLLYITAGKSLFSIRLNTKGYHLPSGE
jgi:gluconolactonase